MANKKLRKMLCDINSPECINLKRLIETQSKATLSGWAIAYSKQNYLKIYEKENPKDLRLREIISLCEKHLNGEIKLAELKPALKQAREIAQSSAENPVAQAAARAVSTACAAVQTPTNALGFLFYGSAAVAYSEAGLSETAEVYNKIASDELKKAFDSIKKVSVADEPNPAKINWNC